MHSTNFIKSLLVILCYRILTLFVLYGLYEKRIYSLILDDRNNYLFLFYGDMYKGTFK